MNFLINLKNKVKREPIKFGIVIILFLLLVGILFRNSFSYKTINPNKIVKNIAVKELSIFVQDGCIHCMNAEDFFNNNKFDNVRVVFYNLKDKNSSALFFKTITKFNIPQKNLGTPVFIFDDNYIVGFGEEQKNNLIKIIKESK